MKITCTGRKVNLKDAFMQRVETKLAKLDKFFSDSAEANVTVTVEKDWQTVEVTVKTRALRAVPRNRPTVWKMRSTRR